MKEEWMEWFSSLWDEFVQRWDRDPDETEWSNLVWLESGENSTAPIALETLDSKNSLIDIAFHELQVPDSMRTEIQRKTRDGNANFYNRKYNDGSF